MIVLVYIFISCVSPIVAQPSDGIHNFKVTVRELPGSVQFSGEVDFHAGADTSIFTQAMDISYYSLVLPIYAYYQVEDSIANIIASFEGTSHPGVFDSTFFMELDASFFLPLQTNETNMFIANYETGCPSGSIAICFNRAFSGQYLRLKFQGITGNTKGASVRWSILMKKTFRSSDTRAFKIVDTRS